MNRIPHELHEHFPDRAEALARLAAQDASFAALKADYDLVNAEIWRGETHETPMDDVRLENLKKQRVHLLDAIAHRLAAA